MLRADYEKSIQSWLNLQNQYNLEMTKSALENELTNFVIPLVEKHVIRF